MGLFSRDKPKIKVVTTKADGFSGWLKCTSCHEMVHANELSKSSNCCPKCGYHYRISIEKRIEMLADEGTFERMFNHLSSEDPLGFVDTETYPDRIRRAQAQSSEKDAIIVGCCEMGGHKVALAVLNFSFMAGSMGSVVGEVLTLIIEHAIAGKYPLVIVSASGGARMQESTFSLMQMAKTSAALAKLSEEELPFISVLTNPTLGGVTASFASLGDIILAEPDALIGFAGPRVVEQVIRQKLPKGAQHSEFLLEHGMIDGVVERTQLKKKIVIILSFLTGNQKEAGMPFMRQRECTT
jgi:acetyl-CoA carboxylase carboxyl transferase subunit beta